MMQVYLDHAATTPLDSNILEAMTPYFQEHFANPSSQHRYGQKARNAVERSREQIARALGCQENEIIFTSGATESINQGIISYMLAQRDLTGECGHVITGRLEHTAVLAACRYLETRGFPVTYLSPNAEGQTPPEALEQALQANTQLVALMYVNNETGVINDISKIAQILHHNSIPFFCDAVQALGCHPIDLSKQNIQMMPLSAHKVYGPKGIGILYKQESIDLPPYLKGGEQERGYRGGTLNVPAIVGAGLAIEQAVRQRETSLANMQRSKDLLSQTLLNTEGIHLNAPSHLTSPKHLNIRVDNIDGEAMLIALDQRGIMLSAGSACSAGSLEPSHVLINMGLSKEAAKASFRFSFAKNHHPKEILYAAQTFQNVLTTIREHH